MSNDSLAYWDSCIFIDRLEASNEDRTPVLRAMTDAAEEGQLKIVTSSLALVEVVKLKELNLPDDEKEDLIVEFFESEYIHIRNVDPRTALLARRIVRGHRLKPPDAIHIATAILSKVQVLHTYDDNHLTPLNEKVYYEELMTKPLRIEHPTWVKQPSIFDVPPEGGSATGV